MTELLEAIERIDRRLNAFVALRPDAALVMEQKDGSLAGVPIAVKDVFVDDDRAPTMGSNVHARGMKGTAAVLRRLRAAGAGIVGYTNMHEWAIGTTSAITATGPVRNPWDTDRVAGGSSGGSAAAVAAGVVPIALGSDAGGSIRVPAACCGVVGFKPTWGAVPDHGSVFEGSPLDHVGPIARRTADVTRTFEVIAGRAVDAPDPSRLRIGIARRFFFENVDLDVGRVAERAAEVLGAAGRGLVDVEVDGAEEGGRVAGRWLLTLVARLVGRDLDDRSDDFHPKTRTALLLGRNVGERERAEARSVRERIVRAWEECFASADVVVTPTIPAPAATIERRTVDLPAGTMSADVAYIAWNAPMNLAGVPALSVPAGETAMGLPIGVTLTSAPGNDDVVLAVGDALERGLDRAFSGRVAPIE